MKNNSYYLWTYVITLIIGVLLLIFTGRTNLFNIIVTIIGVLFIIPSVVMLFMGFAGKTAADGTRQSRPWYTALVSIGALVFGVLLVVMPGFFSRYLIYTLAIILILEGIAQILDLNDMGNDVGGIPWMWYVMPWLTVAAGVIIIIVGPAKVADTVTIITGAIMVLYSVNGLMGHNAHRSAKARITKSRAEEALEFEKGENEEKLEERQTARETEKKEKEN